MKKESNTFFKSSTCSLRFSNSGKIDSLDLFISEFRKVCQIFIDKFWNVEKIPNLVPREFTSNIDTWLSARAIQAAAKQASGIVRGTRKKQGQRRFKHQELFSKGMFKKARILQKIIEKNECSKPDIQSLQPNLDSRFITIDLDNETSFDGWIVLSSLGNSLKIEIPFQRTRHFNWMESRGSRKSGLQLSSSKATFTFEIEKPPQKEKGSTIGLDIGMKSIFTASDGQVSHQDRHGWNLESIQRKLSRRKKGSVGFRKAQDHRKNHINWSINQLNFKNVKILRIERMKHLRQGRRSSRLMTHWTYKSIFEKLTDVCLESGVQIQQVSPTFTSQRCSKCGWVRKRNRKKKQFKCDECGFATDSDLNASLNISLELPAICKKQRLSRPNLTGFYWEETTQEPIVPEARKAVS